MNQQLEKTALEPASVPPLEQPYLQHLDALMAAFRREAEQAFAGFQAAVAATHERVVQRATELRGGLVSELQTIQTNAVAKADAESHEILQRATRSAEDVMARAQQERESVLARTKAEAQEALATANTEAGVVAARAQSEAESLLAKANQDADEVLDRAHAEAEDAIVQANAEADLIIARATTVAAEKVLAHRSGSSSYVGKAGTSGRLVESHSSEEHQAVLSPSDSEVARPQTTNEGPEAGGGGLGFLSGKPGDFLASTVQATSVPSLATVAPAVVASSVSALQAAVPSAMIEKSLPASLTEVQSLVSEPISFQERISLPVLPVMAEPVEVAPIETSVMEPPPLPVVAEEILPSLPNGPVPSIEIPPPAVPVNEVPLATLETPPASVPPVVLVPEPALVPEPTPAPPQMLDLPPLPANLVSLMQPAMQPAAPTASPFSAVTEVESPEIPAAIAMESPVVEVPVTPPVGEMELLDRDRVVDVVSAKTGYPREMLEEHLSSGAKLDLTPPKVVEILAALDSQFPTAPKIEFSRIPAFLELSRLVGYLSKPLDSTAQVVEEAPVPAVELPPVSSPFQLASEPPSMEGVGSPFQAFEPVDAVPFSPFALAKHAADFPGGEVPLATPMEPSLVPEFSRAGIESPFKPAETSSPFQAVSDAVPAPTEESTIPEIAPQAVMVAPAEPEVPAERHVLRGQLSPACGLGLPQLHAVDLIHIVPDDRRIADALLELLLSEGFRAEIVSTVPEVSTAVIVLSGLSKISSPAQAADVQLEGFKAARAVVRGSMDRRGLFVTVQDTGGDFGMSSGSETNVWAGGLPGLARTVVAEWPDIGVKALDVEREGRSAEVLARRILREIAEGGPEVEVGLSADGTRLTQALEATDLPQSRGHVVLAENDTVIVHGAGRGILTEPVLEMARRQRQRFVLLGSVVMQEDDNDPFAAVADPDDIRRALLELARHHGERAMDPEVIDRQLRSFLQQREVRRLMTELRALGSNVCYFAVDSVDAGALESVINQVRGQWGEIGGIVHAGGSRDEGRLDVKTEDHVSQTLRANIAGAENLLTLTRQDNLKLIGFLSPSLHECGSAGHADYAMANETLNRIACGEAHRRGGQCIVRSINWAFVDDGTVTSQEVERLSSQGIQIIPRSQSGRLIVDELSETDRGDIQVILAPRRPSGRAVLHTSYLNSQTEVQVDQAGMPQLMDHRVQGAPAVPGVMVMEWFLRNARQLAGSKGYIRCRDFQQLQGIALPDFGKAAVPFSIVMDSLSSFQWGGQSSVRLVDADGQLRYAALLEQVESKEALGLTAAPELELERTAWTGSHVYGPGALFHGPAFQVIHRVEGVSPAGALGRLLPPEDARWPEDAYLFHPAMIDGITQLAFVWGLFTQDREFFVTSIGEFVQAPNPNYNQAFRCVLEGLDSSPEYLRLNAYLESDAGDTVAVMRNVECHPIMGRSQS